MMELKYNNKIYKFNALDSFDNLIQRADLIGLPLKFWQELFMMKDNECNPLYLSKILNKTIDWYDNSKHVNSFIYKGITSWLDKNTRVGLMNLANCSNVPIQLVLENQIVELTPEELKQYLAALEIYASKCYINTAKHKLKASELHSVEDIVNYDYTVGYPDKLVIE